MADFLKFLTALLRLCEVIVGLLDKYLEISMPDRELLDLRMDELRQSVQPTLAHVPKGDSAGVSGKDEHAG